MTNTYSEGDAERKEHAVAKYKDDRCCARIPGDERKVPGHKYQYRCR